MEPLQNFGLNETVSPVLLEGSEQHLLRVIKLGKRAGDAHNLHIVFRTVLADRSCETTSSIL
jgi:hypothetical protein